MSLFQNPDQIKLLQELLNPKEQNRDVDASDTDEENATIKPEKRQHFGPAQIGIKSDNITKQQMTQNPNCIESVHKQPKTLEEWQEMQEQEDAKLLDTRKQPEYSYAYRQAIGTEDVFLQLSNRNGASASCEDLVLEILVPGDETPADKMILNISEVGVELSTAMYYLQIPLPHRVKIEGSKANYDTQNQKLILTFRLVRELDFINF